MKFCYDSSRSKCEKKIVRGGVYYIARESREEEFQGKDRWYNNYADGKSILPQLNRKKGKMDVGGILYSRSPRFPPVVLSNLLGLRADG